jgi:SAM-dependent methyltransferase
LFEIGRTLKPGGRVLLAIPQDWEVHQAPHDYFRYTRYGIEHLLRQAGLRVLRMEPAGGYFRLLSRRLLNGIQFFKGGWRWLLFLPAAACLGPPALLLPLFEPLDPDKNFTLGYICEAQRLPSLPPPA